MATTALGISIGLNKSFANKTLQTKTYQVNYIQNNIGIFTESGGTIGFYKSEEGIVVIDSQFKNSITHFLELGKKEFNSPYKYLINTHHHKDHTSGNIEFKDKVEHIVAQDNCFINYKNQATTNNDLSNQLFPDITFSKQWGKKIGNETVFIQYFGAAHTNGDSIIHFKESNIAHLGDLVFNKIYPFIDKTNGGVFTNWILVLERIIQYLDTKTTCIFGHAANNMVVGNVEDIKGMKNYIEKLLSFVNLEKKQGKSMETIISNTSAIPNVGEWKDNFKQLKSNLTVAFDEV